MAPNLISVIAYKTNTHVVCEDLRERFNKYNDTHSFNFHKDISTLTQGTLSIFIYYLKLKDLWAEFDVLVPSPGCDCPKSKDFVVFLQSLRVYQFIMGQMTHTCNLKVKSS